ncbi:MAG: rhodanese-like domain-containing protein [Planctomycetota bacterium]
MPETGADDRRTCSLILASLLTALLLVGCGNISDARIKPISLAELRPLVQRQTDRPNGDALLLIDSRITERYETGHLPTARNVVLGQIPTGTRGGDPRITRFDEVVVYGQDPSSAPARALTKRLIGQGYGDIRMFFDGFDGWERAGLVVERGPDPEPWDLVP